MGLFLMFLSTRDHFEYTSVKKDPHQTGNPHHDDFVDRYFERLPHAQLQKSWLVSRSHPFLAVYERMEKKMETTSTILLGYSYGFIHNYQQAIGKLRGVAHTAQGCTACGRRFMLVRCTAAMQA